MQSDMPFARPVQEEIFKINIRDLQKIPLSEL
jgi:hypothetical protein